MPFSSTTKYSHHSGRSRGLIRHHYRLHRSPPLLLCHASFIGIISSIICLFHWECKLSSQLLTYTFHQFGFHAVSLRSKLKPFFLTRKSWGESYCRTVDIENAMDSNTEADRCSPPDEMDLVARIIAGDSGLFHQLVRPYERDAYLIAFSMLLDPARAEEVVQEAFISAYRDLENFHGDSRFRNWLFQVIVDRAKSRKRLEKTICPLTDRQDL